MHILLLSPLDICLQASDAFSLPLTTGGDSPGSVQPFDLALVAASLIPLILQLPLSWAELLLALPAHKHVDSHLCSCKLHAKSPHTCTHIFPIDSVPPGDFKRYTGGKSHLLLLSL